MKSKLIVALDADSFQEAAAQVPATWDVVDDQRRAMTPAETIIAGADYIVVGRPIIAAKDPTHAALKIAEEIVFAAGSLA